MSVPNPKFQLYKSEANSQYYFRLTAENGEIILQSEGYKSKQNGWLGINSVKANAFFEKRFERKESKDGKFYFVLKATNGEPIGTSEMYETSEARDNGISSVKKVASTAAEEDLVKK